MAEIKDKIVTVESLSALHDHNKDIYMTKVNPTGTGTLFINRESDTVAGDYSVAIGHNTEASAFASYAEGDSTTASELDAHAEGRGTVASGKHSHAQGIGTTASGTGSHAEGTGTVAEGMYCHAEGASTIAKGYQTHAEGTGTIAAGSDQHVHGRYNIESPYQYITVIGNRENNSGTITRSNAHTLDWSGNAWFAGDVYVGGNDYSSGTRLLKETDAVTKVTQDYSTENNMFPLLMSATAGITSTNSRGDTTAIVNNDIYADPSMGTLFASDFYCTTAEADLDVNGLNFYRNDSSKITGTGSDGELYEMLRIGETTNGEPICMVGDGMFTAGVGCGYLLGGTDVYMKAGKSNSGVRYNYANDCFIPVSNSVTILGNSAYKWKQIYASSATIQTSDEREKNNIMAIADYPSMFSRTGSGNIFEQLFSKLTPKTYYLNIEEDKPELHIGFVAQDVAAILEESGMTEDDLGLLVHDYWTDEETGEEKDAYGLRYEEFIALNTYMIQRLIAEKDDIKARLEKIEETLGIFT